MEGIYTVSVNGTNEQQLTTGGSVPAWQSVDAPAQTAAQTAAPNPPSTGYGPANDALASSLLPVALLFTAVTAFIIIVKLRQHRLRNTHGSKK